MKIYTFVKGLIDGKPNLFVSVCDHCPEGWVLIDTREIHFNISTDEILELAKKSQEHLDLLNKPMTSEQYETEANADHLTSEQFPNV